jgi:hypothetical protein
MPVCSRPPGFDHETAAWVLNVLLSTAPPAQLTAADVGLVDWSQPIQLTDLSLAARIDNGLLQRCTAIPTLTRLQAIAGIRRYERACHPNALPSLSTFARLQQLCLEFRDVALLIHLAHCTQLRVLQLSSSTSGPVNAESLCAIVSANAATLEELRFCLCWKGYSLPSAFAEGGIGAAKWSVLASCARLRVLELPLKNPMRLSSHLLRALADAQSLELALPAAPSECTPQMALLPSALASSSWCSVRLFLPAGTTDADLLSSAPDVAKMLPLMAVPPSIASLRRLRVFMRGASLSTERCFRLRMTNDGYGSIKWQREY